MYTIPIIFVKLFKSHEKYLFQIEIYTTSTLDNYVYLCLFDYAVRVSLYIFSSKSKIIQNQQFWN